MRWISPYRIKDRCIDPGHTHLRGDWTLGEENYPDHEYDND